VSRGQTGGGLGGTLGDATRFEVREAAVGRVESIGFIIGKDAASLCINWAAL
jgi:hypothetical protein